MLEINRAPLLWVDYIACSSEHASRACLTHSKHSSLVLFRLAIHLLGIFTLQSQALRAKIGEFKLFKMAVPAPNGAKPQSGIRVIIVGAGFGGLTAAIECVRQGHSPIIYESFPSLKILGDIISFGPNAGRIFARWEDGEIARAMCNISIDLQEYGFNIHKWDTGEVVINQKTPPRNETAPVFNGHRGELHEIVFKYAEKLGVKIVLNSRVENYWETEDAAGIILGDGTRVEGDVVVGSDGVRSKARTLVLGYEDKPKSSGYAVWRAWFSNKDMLADPETKQFCENGDTFNGWIGKLNLNGNLSDEMLMHAQDLMSTSFSAHSKVVAIAAGC